MKEIEDNSNKIESRTMDAIKTEFENNGYEKGKQEGILEMVNKVRSMV